MGRGLGIVGDEHGGGALPGRLLELVGPAAVIGHRPALEIALPQRLLPVRIVDEDDDRLSLYVDIRIIVPAPFRCIYAIALQDDVGLRHTYLRQDRKSIV